MTTQLVRTQARRVTCDRCGKSETVEGFETGGFEPFPLYQMASLRNAMRAAGGDRDSCPWDLCSLCWEKLAGWLLSGGPPA